MKTRKILFVVLLAAICTFAFSGQTFAKTKPVKIKSFKSKQVRTIISNRFDKNNDGYISKKEIKQITNLRVDYKNFIAVCQLARKVPFAKLHNITISDVVNHWGKYKGYSYANNLKKLHSINLCGKKTSFPFQKPGKKRLKKICIKDLEKIKNLKKIEIESVGTVDFNDCGNQNKIEEIYIDSVEKTNFKDIGKLEKLEELEITSVKKIIGLSEENKVKDLWVQYIEKIDLSGFKNLTELTVMHSGEVGGLDNCSSLKDLWLSECNVEADFSKITAKNVYISNVNDGKISIENNKYIKELQIYGTDVQIRNCSNLRTLEITAEACKCIVQNNEKLKKIEFSGNSCSESGETDEIELTVNDNQLLKKIVLYNLKVNKYDYSNNNKDLKITYYGCRFKGNGGTDYATVTKK